MRTEAYLDTHNNSKAKDLNGIAENYITNQWQVRNYKSLTENSIPQNIDILIHILQMRKLKQREASRFSKIIKPITRERTRFFVQAL